MTRSVALFLAGAILLYPGCAPAPAPESAPSLQPPPQTGGAEPASAASRPRPASDLLGEAEIRQSQATNAYDVVARLRPGWLRNRGVGTDPDGSREVQVWFNGQPIGPTPALRRYDAAQVVSMRYVDGISARTTYGSGNGRGVIAVTGR